MAAPSNAAMAAPSIAPDCKAPPCSGDEAVASGSGIGTATNPEPATDLKSAIQEMCDSVREPLDRLYEDFAHLNGQYLGSIRDAARRAGISEAQLNYKMELLPKAAREIILQAIANPRPVVAFAGANSSGKSSLINVLLGVQLMPTGDGMVTGNACRLRHSTMENAKISFYRVNDCTFSLERDESLPEISLNGIGIDDLPDILSIVLLRSGANLDTTDWSEKAKEYLEHRRMVPTAENVANSGTGDAQRLQWSTTVIDVQYPLSLLEPGFEIVDLPGTTQADKPEIQQFLKDFLRIIRPIPVFVFQNPTIADAELACLHLMQECLVSGELGGLNMTSVEMGSPIFLASNHFDLDDIYSSIPENRLRNGLTQEHIHSYSVKRYNLVKASASIQNMFPLPIPDDLNECHSIGFISCRDLKLLRRKSQEDQRLVNCIFSKFVSRFLAYIASGYRSQLMNATSMLLYATEVFMSVIHAKPSEMKSFVAEAANARDFIKELKQELKEKVERDYLPAAYRTIQEKAKDAEFVEKSKAKAAATPIREDNKNLFHEEDAFKSLLTELTPWITDEVYLPALTKLNKKVAKYVSETLHRRINELPLANRILNAAASSVLGWEFLKQGDVSTVKSKKKKGDVTLVKALAVAGIVLTLPLGIALSLVLLPFLFAGENIARLVKEIDASWKTAQVEKILVSIGSSNKTIDINACGQVILARIEEEIERRVELYTLITQLQKDLYIPFNSDLSPQFTNIGALALRLRTTLTHGTKNLPDASTIENSPILANGRFAKVHEFEWNGFPHVLKVPRHDIMKETISKEIMYSFLLAPLGFIELKGVVLIQDRVCMIFPRYDYTLKEWLVRFEGQLTHHLFAKILIGIAKTLESLHRMGFIYRQLKMENIFVRRRRGHDWEVVLADFGIYVNAQLVEPERPDPEYASPDYLAPELRSEEATYDKFGDVWAFGVLIWEMVPKPSMPLCKLPANKKNLFLPLPTSTHPVLIEIQSRCMKEDPNERGDFVRIVHELQNLIPPDSPGPVRPEDFVLVPRDD
jgi:energy-coupling factor transporter ATP-binding protein EcfA2